MTRQPRAAIIDLMAKSDPESFEATKWRWTAVVAPVFRWVAGLLPTRAKGGRSNAAIPFNVQQQNSLRNEAILRTLTGLTIESKAVLVYFYDHSSSARRFDSFIPGAWDLEQLGIINIGDGGGIYDVSDKNTTVTHQYWVALADWVVSDPAIAEARMRAIQFRHLGL